MNWNSLAVAVLCALQGGNLESKAANPAGKPQSPESGSRAERRPLGLRFTPDPALPNVLILGDSISIGYTLPVRQRLKGKANVFRPLGPEGVAENCSDTSRGLGGLDRWLAAQPKWDVIHFNWGLHDLKHMKKGLDKPTPSGDPNDPPLHTLEEYGANLEKIVRRLQETGAKLILATTTPVPTGASNPFRSVEDPPKYNVVAVEVARRFGVSVNDLYAFVHPRLGDLQRPENVHFTAAGSQALGGQVAEAVEAALKDVKRAKSLEDRSQPVSKE